jgi:hypothetical protein
VWGNLTRHELILGNEVTSRDIHNLVAKIKRELREEGTTVTRLQKSLEEFATSTPGNNAKIVVSDGIATCITIQTGFMRKLFSAFPEVLLVDATYNTNANNYKLFSFMVHDAYGNGQFVQHNFLDSESADNMRTALAIFKENNEKWEDVQVIVVSCVCVTEMMFNSCG